MKRLIAFLLLCVLLLLSFTACTVKESVELLYGDTYQITNDKLKKYETLEWKSSDTEIAEVQYGQITGVGAGIATITAHSDGKEIGNFTVTVTTIPITGIILSSGMCELTEEGNIKLEYTLFPENASDVGLLWKSTDETIASVDESGVITGVAPGQATISLSTQDGVMDTCSVTVLQKPAYERLSQKEQAFVDLALKYLNAFKNPGSVVIKEIEEATLNNTWVVTVSAQNGFGGNSIDTYMLDDSFGFWNWGSLDIDLELDITPDKSYNISLINEAIGELR